MDFPTKEPAGTLVVDTSNTYLYYVLGGGRAIRYGVRVGRDGFTWNGVQKISARPNGRIGIRRQRFDRQTYVPRFMAGGPGNPLGARAMYLGTTVYASTAPTNPQRSASSSRRLHRDAERGCLDLFDRVKVGTRVVVIPGNPAGTATARHSRCPGQCRRRGGGSRWHATTVVPPLPAPVTVRTQCAAASDRGST